MEGMRLALAFTVPGAELPNAACHRGHAMKRRFLASLALLALAACGDLPQPFRGNPGGMAGRLAVPPPYRLAVSPPETALLSADESEAFARAIAEALLRRVGPPSAPVSSGRAVTT